ncbi:ComEC/Rec2 family competence protein [Anditalea andensis]|uniref:Competence protein ComEC n=1 Tax=Anditalea andensis TaxID=1048983 RepID=A0A074L1W8_9BACT|nr:ComEC/Rec2 family competence protein [Anditalea andensis]KEO75124.1 hypothetical protein EL17_05485 [Anditalea andensis]
MAFNEFPFLRYAVFFILGIIIYPFLEAPFIERLFFFFIFIFLIYNLLTLYTSRLREFKNRGLISCLGLTLWVALGVLVSYVKDVKNDPLHLMYHHDYDGYMGIVQHHDEVKPKSFRNTIFLTHIMANDKIQKVKGEVIIYHQSKLSPGQVIAVIGRPNRIAPPENPNEFNYAQFLSRYQIYHTHFVGKDIEIIGWTNHRPLNFFFLSLRKSIQHHMDRTILDPRARQIAQALLLGQKQNLDAEVSEAYSTAGAMHILAVSGLHVGIIYGFFFLFFKPYQLPPYKRMAYLSIVISIIWIYAFLTGMSPSVMRSATMFTIVSMAQMRSSSPSIYNGLAISAILLLLFDPNLIYSVGFQLSYAALTGILVLQPAIVNVWLPQNRIIYRCWEITSVGIAAQLATFPISAYYFHSFPSYFFMSNLIAIPGAFVVMAIGIPYMLLAFLPYVGIGLGLVLNHIIIILNRVIFILQDLPFAKISDIKIEPWEVIWYYGVLILIFIMLTSRIKKLAQPLILVMVMGVCIIWIDFLGGYHKNEIYLYTGPSGRAVDYFYRHNIYSWNEGWEDQDVKYKLSPNRIAHGIHSDVKELHYADGQLILPKGYIISTEGRFLSFINFIPKEVARYNGTKWLAVSSDSLTWKDNTAYRILLE